MTNETTNEFSPECAPERCGWCSSTRAITAPRGRPAAEIGCTGETLRLWLKRAEQDSRRVGSATQGVTAWLKAQERENRELRQATEILRKGDTELTKFRAFGNFMSRVSSGVYPHERPLRVDSVEELRRCAER